MVAISKGPDRDAGRERFHMNDRQSFIMKPNDPVLYYLQRLRDEAHRFAVGSHRIRRSQSIAQSRLDEIPGIGGARKRALGNWPDLLLIDGGIGQLGAVRTVLEELAVDDLPVVAISKGPDRDAGRERFFRSGRDRGIGPGAGRTAASRRAAHWRSRPLDSFSCRADDREPLDVEFQFVIGNV